MFEYPPSSQCFLYCYRCSQFRASFQSHIYHSAHTRTENHVPIPKLIYYHPPSTILNSGNGKLKKGQTAEIVYLHSTNMVEERCVVSTRDDGSISLQNRETPHLCSSFNYRKLKKNAVLRRCDKLPIPLHCGRIPGCSNI